MPVGTVLILTLCLSLQALCFSTYLKTVESILKLKGVCVSIKRGYRDNQNLMTIQQKRYN